MRIAPRPSLVAHAAIVSLGVLSATGLGCGPALEPDPNGRPIVVTSTYDLPPSDYTLDLSAFTFQLDARRTVVSVTGDVKLTEGRRPGESYVVDEGTLPDRPTFGDYDEVYRAGVKHPLGDPPVDVPGSTVLAVGTSLREPVRRTIVVSRTTDGVVAYQALRMDLSAPE